MAGWVVWVWFGLVTAPEKECPRVRNGLVIQWLKGKRLYEDGRRLWSSSHPRVWHASRDGDPTAGHVRLGVGYGQAVIQGCGMQVDMGIQGRG